MQTQAFAKIWTYFCSYCEPALEALALFELANLIKKEKVLAVVN